jgi:3-deoxy-manno-octulosonate cytidylyltransferase (CMP-KDO synthetase)
MLFTVLIPARLASTRLPNKPLADLGGAPMVVRVAQRAQLSQAESVVVATDSQEVIDQCARFDIQAVMTASHHASGSDRLAEACNLLGLPDDAVVVNVQGDEPLIDVALMDAVAQLLTHRPDCAMSTAAHAIDNPADYLNPNIVKVVLDARQNALYFSCARPCGHGLVDERKLKRFATAAAPCGHLWLPCGFLKSLPRVATRACGETGMPRATQGPLAWLQNCGAHHRPIARHWR